MHIDPPFSAGYSLLLEGKKEWIFLEPKNFHFFYSYLQKKSSRIEFPSFLVPPFSMIYEEVLEIVNDLNIDYMYIEQNSGQIIYVPPGVFHVTRVFKNLNKSK